MTGKLMDALEHRRISTVNKHERAIVVKVLMDDEHGPDLANAALSGKATRPWSWATSCCWAA